MSFLPLGKLKPDLLRDFISRFTLADPRILVGPRVGEDAAAVELGDRVLLLTADPITFTPERVGWYAVQVNANDIACMGGTPLFFLSTLLLPQNRTDPQLVESIFSDVSQACREIGCLPVGGHTEITYGLDRPILAGAMIGEVARDRLVTSAGARPGDLIILTKGIAIEATALLAREKASEVAAALGADVQAKAAAFLENPGLSVLPASRAACATGVVHALHDPTEGGVATGLWELAEASEVGLVVSESEIPRYWESTRLAEHFGLDLLGTLASGALLIAVAEPDTAGVLSSLKEAGVTANVIGRVTERRQGVKLLRGRESVDLPRFDADEITKVLS